MPKPLVTIICLPFNKRQWVAQTLASVYQQDYPHIQLIIVDDASTDGTTQLLPKLVEGKPNTQLILLPKNVGMCAAFNHGFALAEGEFVMDLAGDDCLLPGAINALVNTYLRLPSNYAIVHGDAIHIDEQDHVLGYSYARNKQGKLLQTVPSGDVYLRAIKGNFMVSATMLLRKSHMQAVGGYDTTLSYEDYDIKVRLARHYHMAFLDRTVVQKRKVKGSANEQFYSRNSATHLRSTLRILHKIKAMNRSPEEDDVLAATALWFMRLCVYTGAFDLAPGFAAVVRGLKRPLPLGSQVLLLAARFKIPLNTAYRWWLGRRGLAGAVRVK